MKTDIGTVYLLHFDKPYKHCRHYIGYTSLPVEDRLKRHQGKNGAKLLKAVCAAGINFVIARAWKEKTFEFEQSLKKQKNSKKFCPICNPEKYLKY